MHYGLQTLAGQMLFLGKVFFSKIEGKGIFGALEGWIQVVYFGSGTEVAERRGSHRATELGERNLKLCSVTREM